MVFSALLHRPHVGTDDPGRCPKEKRLEGCSYEFVKSESKCGYPDIVCRNHGSTMLRASIVPAEEKDKKRTVVLEEPLRKK